ncbi:Os06g0309550, partial [Oryza sativa Japonica Group]
FPAFLVHLPFLSSSSRAPRAACADLSVPLPAAPRPHPCCCCCCFRGILAELPLRCRRSPSLVAPGCWRRPPCCCCCCCFFFSRRILLLAGEPPVRASLPSFASGLDLEEFCSSY